MVRLVEMLRTISRAVFILAGAEAPAVILATPDQALALRTGPGHTTAWRNLGKPNRTIAGHAGSLPRPA